MAGQPIVALVSLVLVAGAVVLQFFVILSGAVNGTPENKVFFLQAPTAGISGQGFHGYDRIAWTYFALCPISNAKTYKCRSPHPAFPFDPQSNFGLNSHGQNQIPQTFIGTNYYYYMSRFAWAFYLIALVFAVLSLLTGLIATCSRIGGFISGFSTMLGVVFQALAASLMTAWTVKGRDAFNRNRGANASGQPAALGKYAYGFSWGAFAALFIAMILFCVSGSLGKKKESTGESKGFFKRKQSTRSRDGVKSEYS